MHLETHYESYRKSASKDLLPGLTDYAKQTPVKYYGSAFEFFNVATKHIKEAIADKNAIEYQGWIRGHREALLGLLTDYVTKTGLQGMDLIEKKGWRWFRFTKRPICIFGDRPMVWLPRFTGNEKFGDVMFDAEELETIFSKKDTKGAIEFYEFKSKELCKITSDGEILKIGEINTPSQVKDWSMEMHL